MGRKGENSAHLKALGAAGRQEGRQDSSHITIPSPRLSFPRLAHSRLGPLPTTTPVLTLPLPHLGATLTAALSHRPVLSSHGCSPLGGTGAVPGCQPTLLSCSSTSPRGGEKASTGARGRGRREEGGSGSARKNTRT